MVQIQENAAKRKKDREEAKKLKKEREETEKKVCNLNLVIMGVFFTSWILCLLEGKSLEGALFFIAGATYAPTANRIVLMHSFMIDLVCEVMDLHNTLLNMSSDEMDDDTLKAKLQTLQIRYVTENRAEKNPTEDERSIN